LAVGDHVQACLPVADADAGAGAYPLACPLAYPLAAVAHAQPLAAVAAAG
jgi:hypothetical protein